MKKEWKGQSVTIDPGKQPSNKSKDGININGQPGDDQEKYSPKRPPYGVGKDTTNHHGNREIGR